jgi:hypothetical protein
MVTSGARSTYGDNQHFRGRGPFCKIKYGIKSGGVRLADADGMALAHANQHDSTRRCS